MFDPVFDRQSLDFPEHDLSVFKIFLKDVSEDIPGVVRNEFADAVAVSTPKLDLLVNNAGVAPRQRADLTEMSEASFSQVLKVNLQGPFFLTQHVANYWLQQQPRPLLSHGFKVVFISSISAIAASINRGEYCISKAGLTMVSKLWALRLAEQGIQVFELRPGIMATDMTSAVKGKYDERLAEGLVPMRRWGTAEDVGKAVRTILNGEFPFSTGEVLYIDGGLHIQSL